jgi:hypothetical protein
MHRLLERHGQRHGEKNTKDRESKIKRQPQTGAPKQE